MRKLDEKIMIEFLLIKTLCEMIGTSEIRFSFLFYEGRERERMNTLENGSQFTLCLC